MPIIISGLDPYKGLDAYLSGYDRQSRRMEQAQRVQMEQARMQQEYQLEMQRAMAENQREQAAAAKAANERAQMGDAQAMQQQNMIAAAQNQPPDRKRLQEMAGVLGRISDPKARAFATQEFQKYELQLQNKQRQEAAGKMVEQSAADQHISPEEAEQYKMRIQSGEEPETVSKEVAVIRAKRAQSQANMQDSAEAITEAEALVKAIPRETNAYKRALNLLALFKDSPTMQQKDGEAEKMMKAIREVAILGRADEERVSAKKKKMAERPMIGMGGMSPEAFKQQLTELGNAPMFGQPDVQLGPDYQAFAQGLKAEKEKRYPGSTKQPSQGGSDVAALALSLLSKAKDEMDLAKQLKRKGVKLTPENMAAVKAALDQERNRVNAGAGADR